MPHFYPSKTGQPPHREKPVTTPPSAMDRLIRAPESLAQSVLVALCDDLRIQARALKYLGELETYAVQRATTAVKKTATTSAAATTAAAAAAAAANSNNNSNNSKNDDQQGDKAGGSGSGSNANNNNTSSSNNPLKRKKPMEPGQICLQCKHAFIPSGNSAEACLYHPGELDLDDEDSTWDDWDEDVHGPHDSSANREDYPEGFVWGEYCYYCLLFVYCIWERAHTNTYLSLGYTRAYLLLFAADQFDLVTHPPTDCCDGDGTQPGCTKGYHVAIRRPLAKKLRSGASPEDGDFVRMFEGRALKANEFVNELLWTDEWDGYAASRNLGGWGVTETEEEERAEPGHDENGDVTAEAAQQLETTRAGEVGDEGATPPPPSHPVGPRRL